MREATCQNGTTRMASALLRVPQANANGTATMRAEPVREFKPLIVGSIAALALGLLLQPALVRADEVFTTTCAGAFGHGFGISDTAGYNGRYGSGAVGAGHGYDSGSCIEIRREVGNPYVMRAPQPQSAEAIKAAEQRDRLWLDRCQPVIRQDVHGIRRYVYAAPGCEYGKYE